MSNPFRTWRGDRTQEEAGRLLEVDAMTYSRWERGEHLPRKKYWPKIKEQIGVSPLALFKFVNEEKNAEGSQ